MKMMIIINFITVIILFLIMNMNIFIIMILSSRCIVSAIVPNNDNSRFLILHGIDAE